MSRPAPDTPARGLRGKATAALGSGGTRPRRPLRSARLRAASESAPRAARAAQAHQLSRAGSLHPLSSGTAFFRTVRLVARPSEPDGTNRPLRPGSARGRRPAAGRGAVRAGEASGGHHDIPRFSDPFSRSPMPHKIKRFSHLQPLTSLIKRVTMYTIIARTTMGAILPNQGILTAIIDSSVAGIVKNIIKYLHFPHSPTPHNIGIGLKMNDINAIRAFVDNKLLSS